MKVVAKVAGFFGVWREPGDQFQIDGPNQLGSWMEVVEEPKRQGDPQRMKLRRRSPHSCC